jgi:hypothetical protein
MKYDLENLKGRDHLGDQEVNWRIVIKWKAGEGVDSIKPALAHPPETH